ncbi:MAG: DUF4956 domain-containing protein [Bacteroidota bacterium]
MNTSFEQFIANYSVPLSLPGFFLHLALAGIAGWGLGWIYRRYGTVLSNRDGFSQNFILLCMTTTVIISVVKSSLALSLGLVGALSIVRFRSAIKEPEELVYLFFCIAIGLGFGADQLWPTLGAIAMIVPVLVIRGSLNRKKHTQDLLLLLGIPLPSELSLETVLEILDRHCSSIHLKRLDETPGQLDMSFVLVFNNVQALSAMKTDLRTKAPAIRLQFLDQKLLPVS